MEIGVSVPIVEIGDDFGALRDYIQAAEDLGYAHVRILDHVLGAVPEKHPEVPQFPYTHESYIHEPFTLMAYLAAVTKKIGLTTGILILPQRQTALVAKQAAEVDVLSGGRVRLGIGVGWNSVEYEALGVDFATRGSRCDEQIEVLRQLWTENVIDFHGKYHDITHAGINPLPVQRPIPIWIGAGRGTAPTPPNAAIRRIGRLADGYFPMFAPRLQRPGHPGASTGPGRGCRPRSVGSGFRGPHHHHLRQQPRGLAHRAEVVGGDRRNSPGGGSARRGLARCPHRRHPPAEGSHGVRSPDCNGWGMTG